MSSHDDESYRECEICGEKYGTEFYGFIREVELPNGECEDRCVDCVGTWLDP